MKNFDFSLFFGCCIISVGIIIAGTIVANHLPPILSGSFTGTITDGSQELGDYLSEFEASAYVRISSDDFINLIQSGELDGTFVTVQGNTVFSKEKLTEWIRVRIENE